MSIFKVLDLDSILLKFLDIDDLRCLYCVNKYYRNLIYFVIKNHIEYFALVRYNLDNNIWPFYDKCGVFQESIKFGKLDVCQYIYSKCGKMYLRILFKMACKLKHFDIAYWMYSIMLGNNRWMLSLFDHNDEYLLNISHLI